MPFTILSQSSHSLKLALKVRYVSNLQMSNHLSIIIYSTNNGVSMKNQSVPYS